MYKRIKERCYTISHSLSCTCTTNKLNISQQLRLGGSNLEDGASYWLLATNPPSFIFAGVLLTTDLVDLALEVVDHFRGHLVSEDLKQVDPLVAGDGFVGR